MKFVIVDDTPLFGTGNTDARLTSRGAGVMAPMEHGLDNKLIAHRLGRSLPTVKADAA